MPEFESAIGDGGQAVGLGSPAAGFKPVESSRAEGDGPALEAFLALLAKDALDRPGSLVPYGAADADYDLAALRASRGEL